jgi:hypothetical protein
MDGNSKFVFSTLNETDLRTILVTAKKEAVKRMPDDPQYAKISALLNSAIRTLAEIEIGD